MIHLSIGDRLLGNPRLPPRGEWPAEYGLHDPDAIRPGILAQTIDPFVRAKR